MRVPYEVTLISARIPVLAAAPLQRVSIGSELKVCPRSDAEMTLFDNDVLALASERLHLTAG